MYNLKYILQLLHARVLMKKRNIQ